MNIPIQTTFFLFRLFAVISTTLVMSPQLHAIPIRVLAWDDAVAARKLAISDSTGLVIIEDMHPSKRTKAYHVVAGEIPAFIESLDLKDPEGKSSKSPISIPDGIKHPLLVILPDDKAVTGLRLFVLEEDSSDFAWGSTRFINATGRQLVFNYEKKLVSIPAKGNPVDAKPEGQIRNMEVKFFFQDQPKRPFYSGIWEQSTDIRTLVFLIPGEDPRLGPVVMKMIPEDRRVFAAKEIKP